MDSNIFEIGAYGLIYVLPFVCLCAIPLIILAIFLFFRKIHKDANTPETKAKYAKQKEHYENDEYWKEQTRLQRERDELNDWNWHHREWSKQWDEEKRKKEQEEEDDY